LSLSSSSSTSLSESTADGGGFGAIGGVTGQVCRSNKGSGLGDLEGGAGEGEG
jgi:hypothetical protein